MRKLTCLILLSLMMVLPAVAEETKLKDEMARRSYSLGFQFGEDLKSKGVQVDAEMMGKGAADASVGLGSLMTRDEMRATLVELQQEMVKKQQEKMAKLSELNKQMGAEYLGKNKVKEGVTETASGLQYEVVKPGEGKNPTATDTVVVHYRGTLLDGTEFDSSYKRNQPATFPVNGVIQGWQEALKLMKPGAAYKLAIPSTLAYGERGAPPYIQPNSTLLFDVELVEIK